MPGPLHARRHARAVPLAPPRLPVVARPAEPDAAAGVRGRLEVADVAPATDDREATLADVGSLCER